MGEFAMGKVVIRYWHALILGFVLAASWCPRADAGGGPRLFAVQLTASAASTEIVIGLSQPTPFRATALPGDRVAIDFDGLKLIPDASAMKGVGLVRNYHAEATGGGVRLVLDLAEPANVAATRAVPAEPGKPPRVVITLAPGSAPVTRTAALPLFPPASVRPAAHAPANRAPDMIGALIEKPQPPAAAPIAPAPEIEPPAAVAPVAVKQPKPRPEMHEEAIMPVADIVSPAPMAATKNGKSIESVVSPKRTIVIDAGHGGIDPGAESVAGYHEKEITLATARTLARTLEATGRYKVVLTRDSDVYLKLHERVARARAAHGNLFISLHADSAVTDRSTRGASIYTLSETASDTESERYAQRENRADAIGGVDLGDQSDDVAGILVDLTVRETVNDGNRLAGMMVDSLEHKGVMLLPSTPHRSAGFAVLKSPDIPSVLIEMGYLSDMADARALADPRHQQQIASAIADGVDRYFAWLQVSRS
jgi:N-acetylmuramoyl-L-alanine amidase